MEAMESPEFEGGEHYAVQQGAGMVVTKTEDETEEQIEASVEFLKWFTQDERNIQFSLDSGYMPVTKAANNLEVIEENTSLKENDRTFSVVKAAIDTVNDNTLYTTKAFENGKNARSMYPKPADRDQECFHSSSRSHRTANPNVRRNRLVSG